MRDPATRPAGWENRSFARAEGLWFLRHESALARWPVLPEAWARRIEARRIAEQSPGREDPSFLHGARRASPASGQGAAASSR